MAQMRVFLSHSSVDNDVAVRIAEALRGAGADVWLDENNLRAQQLLDEINHQVLTRPVFIVLLSRAAFASDWVRDECKWAYNLLRRDPTRIILPVVVAALAPDAFDEMLYLEDFKRIEGPSHTPYAEADMIERTLRLLAMTPAGQIPASVAPQPGESLDDLLTQGRALAAQRRWVEALDFFQRATEVNSRSATAWGETGMMLGELKRPAEALVRYDRSLALNDQQGWVWSNRGAALEALGRR